MQKDYRKELFKEIFFCLGGILGVATVFVVGRKKKKLPRLALVSCCIGFTAFVGAITERLLLLQIAKDPGVYRQYLGLPIARYAKRDPLKPGGRPPNKIKGGRDMFDPEVLAFHVEARKRWRGKGGSWHSFVAYCRQHDEDPSTVASRLKKFETEIDKEDRRISAQSHEKL